MSKVATAKAPSSSTSLTSKFKQAHRDLQVATSPETDFIVLTAKRRLSPSNSTETSSCTHSLGETRSEDTDASYSIAFTDLDDSSTGSSPRHAGLRSRSSSLIQEDYEQLSRAPKAFIPKPVDEAPFKQLHEICSLPSLSLEMIRIFINTYPLSVRQKDMNGDLPLHVAIRREEPADLVVCELLRKYPQSAFVKDHHGNLPLFMACVRSKVSAKIIKGLLVANPQAASTKVYGSFALHALVHTGGVTPQTIKLLLAANPEGVHTPNNFGNLPLHYLCAHDSPNIDCLRILLEAYPEGITCMNKIGDTPISRALSQTSRTDTEEVRDSMRLLLRSALQSTPSVLSEEQRKTLRQLNWEARRNIVMMCANNAAAPRSESRLALAEISSGITGVWRNILEFL